MHNGNEQQIRKKKYQNIENLNYAKEKERKKMRISKCVTILYKH